MTFYTDEGAAYGTAGMSFSYDLSGTAATPEPSTFTLLALAGLGLAGFRWQRRRWNNAST